MNIVRYILFAVLLLTESSFVQAEGHIQASRFKQLATLLGKAPAPLPSDFARAALQEMIRAYAEEAELARMDRRALARNPGLPRWSRTVDSYSQHLSVVAAGMAMGARLPLRWIPSGG